MAPIAPGFIPILGIMILGMRFYTTAFFVPYVGPDIKETTDPTVEQEKALRVAQEEAEANEAEEEEPEDSEED